MDKIDVLSDADGRACCISVIIGGAERGATEQAMQQVADWANRARVFGNIAQDVLEGRMIAYVQFGGENDGELMFRAASEAEYQAIQEARRCETEE